MTSVTVVTDDSYKNGLIRMKKNVNIKKYIYKYICHFSLSLVILSKKRTVICHNCHACCLFCLFLKSVDTFGG